jgi:glycosyltransferase involved in cell wall biosynthesis
VSAPFAISRALPHASILGTTSLAIGKRGLMSLTKGCRKILFLLPDSGEFGGLERHLLQLLEKLLESDLQVYIICFGPDVLSDRLNPDWLSRLRVQTETEPKTLFGWARLFREFSPDIVVFCYGWILSFPWQANLASVLTGIRRRFAIQHLVLPDIPPEYPGKGLYGTLRRLLGKRARRLYRWRFAGILCTKTICVSEAVRNALVQTLKFSPSKTVTIHNGVSTESFGPSSTNRASIRSRLKVDPDEFLLVCTARLSKVKGVDILIHALSRALRRGVSCKCIILGDGPLRERLVEEANLLHLDGHVLFQGFQSDVTPYLQAASAFILTSYTEGLPLSVLEAMACGLPCIVTDVGGTAEAVKNGVTGLVIAPASVEETENAIAYLGTHPQECSEMASKARETACSSFNLDTQMKQMVDVLLG